MILEADAGLTTAAAAWGFWSEVLVQSLLLPSGLNCQLASPGTSL